MAWKKNLREIPVRILRKLDGIKNPNLVVGCVRNFKQADLQNGILSHLQIAFTASGLNFPKRIIPPPESGRHSLWNIHGREIKRTDLPKETYYRYVESPNYGDPSKGYHTVAWPGERYPREYIAPRNSIIEIECSDPSPGRSSYIIKFQLTEVLNRHDKLFESRLFDCLNLLQENVGDCDIQEAGATWKDYIKTLHVSWDILPPGTVEEAIERIFGGREPSQQEKDTIQERYKFFRSLNPQSLVYGRSGFQRYFGALLRDDLVVFENVNYGNAVYIMFGNWEELSKKSRIELLSGKFGDDFERVIHKSGWKRQVKEIIRERLRGK